MLLTIPDLKLIQCNTDGITAYVPRQYEFMFHAWKSEWEKLTGLDLEEVEYKSMFIKDVNNYIAVDTKGKVKRKGCCTQYGCDHHKYGDLLGLSA